MVEAPVRTSSARSLVFAVGAALVISVPLALTLDAPGILPFAMIAALLGAVGLAGVTAFATAHALARLLVVAGVGLAFLPFDKYFLYVDHVGGWPGIRLGAADLALLPLLVVVGIGWWLGRIRNVIPGSLLVAYALLLAQYVISALAAPHRDLATFELIAAAHAMALALVWGTLYRREMILPVLVIFALGVLVHAGAAGVEFVLGRPVGPASAERTVLQEVLETGATRVRPSGLLIHPIALADFFMLTLPAIGGAALAVRRRWQRITLTCVLVVGAAALGLTLSRGAWLSTGFAAIVFLILASREGLLDPVIRRRLRRVALVVGIGGAIFAPIAYQRITQSDPGNVKVRFALNHIALAMTADHPITGVGLSNFVTVMARYDPKNVESYFPAPAHNLYLLEAAEAGVPGFLLFATFVGLLLASASKRLRAARETTDPLTRWFAVGLIASFWGLVLSQLADFSWRLEPLRTIVWVEIGLLYGMLSPTTSPRPASAPVRPS